MGVTIRSTASYLYLDSWIISSVVHLGTIEFCRKYLNNSNDPGGRQYAQMTQAARSAAANISEGSSRRDTSTETAMKLLDVARATVSELAYDYLSLILLLKETPWTFDDPRRARIHAINIPPANYSQNLMHDVGLRILDSKQLFAPWLDADLLTAANTMIVLCGRLNRMLTHQLEYYLKVFRHKGGFTENMTKERLRSLKDESQASQGEICPKCGKYMVKRIAKRGKNAGKEFWSCSEYPNCTGSKPI